MPNLDVTDLNDLQISDAQNDKRFQELGLVNIAKHSSAFVDYIPADAVTAMETMSSDRDLQIPVILDQTVVVNTDPGFNNIPPNLLTTSQFNFVGINIFSGFDHYPGQYANNVIAEERGKQAKMKNVLFAMGQALEGEINTVLEARKTQKLAFTTQISQGVGGQTYTFDETPDILKVNKAAQQNTMFTNIDEVMTANDLGGRYSYVSSRAGFAVQKHEMATLGQGNAKDLQALGMPDASFLHQSNTISAGSDVFNGFAIRDGAVGIITNHPWDFRDGTEFAGKKWSVTDQEMPFLRGKINVWTDNEATDARALAASGTNSDLQMTHVQRMGMWWRGFIVFRFNNDLANRANDVVKLQGLTT